MLSRVVCFLFFSSFSFQSNPNPNAFPNNVVYVRQFVSNLLLKAFPNLTPPQVDAFVVGLFTTQKNVQDFKTHLRDFLVQLKVRNNNTQTRTDGRTDRPH